MSRGQEHKQSTLELLAALNQSLAPACIKRSINRSDHVKVAQAKSNMVYIGQLGVCKRDYAVAHKLDYDVGLGAGAQHVEYK